ncbi:protein-S-isoprenylcysteine carboxyl O-methyltransferase SKDI_04G6190 [Saccharomyces kudriavzevii IFO 1802]|uniref:Uncharacterized protein n=2 Tax=Saccharomyces kudriavzevii (strain ATCC MYA-4449 / AS 2.2408 / CBS 8840 / NBRC 1802 / NCYC 2889) TaxID=226230 RepID=A0AA35JG85_SACK1|nr:uncharacterized protein SKDI_04G6190 [Saccharomyces kudriavzevii IFO 1802]EJT41935.1 STE14-like protein [Saccharomyces kudriavzevii IFO 1802]CAI4059200.1 hypothetical protein SKDI_04G6190 [Saccharomyces kudriavzevii IFO 1802]
MPKHHPQRIHELGVAWSKTILYMTLPILENFPLFNYTKKTIVRGSHSLFVYFFYCRCLIVEHNMFQDHPDANDERKYPDIKRNPLHEVTKTSYILGVLLGISLGLLPQIRFKNFNIFIIALSLFHFLEYYITAKYNPLKVHSESFLLNNGKSYMAAHSFAILECLIESLLFPDLKISSYSRITQLCTILGCILIILGQYSRTTAMHAAGHSFSHIVKTKKEPDHVLVKTGIYAWSRHPSYFGFFWWAIGTQLLLLNPISLVIFISVLWKFFNDRIRIEEKYLVEFFGRDYIDYKKEVSVGIPLL